MLQTLSKDKAFGRGLNKIFDGHASLPANIRIHNFHGTYGDYLICVCVAQFMFENMSNGDDATALTLHNRTF